LVDLQHNDLLHSLRQFCLWHLPSHCQCSLQHQKELHHFGVQNPSNTSILASWSLLMGPLQLTQDGGIYSMHDKLFNNHAVNNSGLPPLSTTVPMHTHVVPVPPGIDVLYYLHGPDKNPSSVVGASVISVDGLCPPFVPEETPSLFGHHIGIKFLHDGHSYV
jgi:hypothetical protein